MTCRTLRCPQGSTWSGSGFSGTSATFAGTLPRGFRPGRPRGLAPAAAPATPSVPVVAVSTVEAFRVPPSSVASFITGPPGSVVVVVGADGSGCGHESQTSVRPAWKVSHPCGMTIPYLRSIERGCDRTEILSNDHSAELIVRAG